MYTLKYKFIDGYIKTIYLFLLVLVFSCSENVLDVSPSDRYSDIEVWGDTELIETFVNNTYYQMPHGFLYPFSHNLSVYTDEAYYKWGSTNFINEGNISSDQMGNLNRWNGKQKYWNVVTKCNIFFKNIDNAEGDEELVNRLKGEMRFLRGFAYMMMNQLWGGVPIITQPFTLNDDFSVPRGSYDECMEFIISEFDAAINLLPESYGNDDLGRITKGAAMAAKSRATLYWASPLVNPNNDMSRWQDAAAAAKAVIDLGNYSLFDDYKTLFLRDNAYNSEVIWALPFNYPITPQRNFVELSLYPNGYGGYGQAQPLHNLIDDFETLNGLQPEDDPSYDDQNPYENRDPRLAATIFYDGLFFQDREVETFLPGGLDSREGPTSPSNASETGYYMRKFCDDRLVNPNTVVQGNSPYIYFRYAEILLNYAEAMYQLGKEDECRSALNMVRSRNGVEMPDVKDEGEELFQRVINERRIELVFEEHRYFDVRRWKIAPDVLNKDGQRIDIIKGDDGKKTYTVVDFNPRSFNERNYWLPLPLSEVEKNLSMEQNPGY